MNSSLFLLCLLLHITGIVLLAGTTLASYIISRKFWSSLKTDRHKALIINSTTTTFERLTALGGVLTILSGIAMVALLEGIVAWQFWFKIKMALVVFIILNASLFARPQNLRLKKNLSLGHPANDELRSAKSKISLYYAVQLILLFSIFVLSVFRFQ
jgi:hypothetical protein